MAESVYIHIPFCRSKCYYCSFVSYPKEHLKAEYINALIKEINLFYKNEQLKTLYFGGGTPSLLSGEEFSKIIGHFNINENTEITAELNPEGYSKNGPDIEYLTGLKNAGINRISIGSQSFDDNILKLINRRHNSSQIVQAVESARLSGYKNISLDFIYGLPDQTSDMFLADLQKAINLDIEHISLYGLSVEKGCYFYDNKPKNIADDDLQAEMYLKAVEFLTQNGFNHYEFSNFAKAGFESRHNLNYWNNNEYYAFGTASHGYLSNERYSHTNSVEEYINNPSEHIKEYNETSKSKLEEEIFLGFRKMCGIDAEEINQKYGIDFEDKYKKIIDKYISTGFMKKTLKGYALTPKGVLVSNTILAEFID